MGNKEVKNKEIENEDLINRALEPKVPLKQVWPKKSFCSICFNDIRKRTPLMVKRQTTGVNFDTDQTYDQSHANE